MTVHSCPQEQGKRRRRAHQKSRQGCGNCKLRRVKCDETHPRCKRCISFGVSCNYDSTSDELQLAMDGALVFKTPHGPPVSFNQLVLNMINTPPKIHLPSPKTTSVYELRLEDLEIVNRFQSRTVLTMGTKESVHVLQREWFRVACEHSMLMHVILALTLMHDRYIAGFANAPHFNEAYHHYQATVMFKRKLTNHEPQEKDALWAAAALLGAMSFANINVSTHQEAWPLKAPSESDLDWLRMTDGKKVVWQLVDPMREGSIIREAWQQMSSPRSAAEPGLAASPTSAELCGLRECAAGEENACRNAASILIPLVAIECNHSTIAQYLSFFSHTEPEFKRLLVEKDPVALLLLAYWFARMCQYKQWWIQPRAVLECQAICVFLNKRHGDKDGIKSLLQFPRIMSGLAYDANEMGN